MRREQHLHPRERGKERVQGRETRGLAGPEDHLRVLRGGLRHRVAAGVPVQPSFPHQVEEGRTRPLGLHAGQRRLRDGHGQAGGVTLVRKCRTVHAEGGACAAAGSVGVGAPRASRLDGLLALDRPLPDRTRKPPVDGQLPRRLGRRRLSAGPRHRRELRHLPRRERHATRSFAS